VPTLRLLCYNVRSLRDDGDAVARVIRDSEPHVVCLQEAPRFVRWRAKGAALARRSGLVVVAGGRLAAANLILSSLAVDVVSTRDVLFSTDHKLHHRGTAIAVLTLAGVRFAVVGTHLDLVEGPRLRHVTELHKAIDEHVPADVPAIVAGDINDVPDSATWRQLATRGEDAWAQAGDGDGFTFSAKQPQRRIDGVFADRRVRAVRAEVIGSADVSRASDHRPLLVEIELNGRGS
jgi:endonuclease/exonuclease/phosphatase family metal-dependent hydrolase